MGPNTRNTGTEFQEQIDRLFREQEPESDAQDADEEGDKTSEE